MHLQGGCAGGRRRRRRVFSFFTFYAIFDCLRGEIVTIQYSTVDEGWISEGGWVMDKE
jgi:hypothetical protein